MSEVSVTGAISITLDQLYAKSYISQLEYCLAHKSLELATNDISVGYEIELRSHKSSLLFVPFADASNRGDKKLDELASAYENTAASLCESLGGRYRTWKDELYEVASPPTPHPFALYIGHLGIIRAGLLPGGQLPQDVATLHTSVGHRSEQPYKTKDYLPMARTIEALGGSCPERLIEPFECFKGNYTFDRKGNFGVRIDNKPTELKQNDPKKDQQNDKLLSAWVGDQKRVEFRSFIYTSPKQLLTTLDATFYLSQAKFATKGTPLASRYEEFEQAFHNVRQVYDLPDIPTAKAIRQWNADKYYHEAYADMLNNPWKNEPLRMMGRLAILDIREELGMTHIPTPFHTKDYWESHPMPPNERHSVTYFTE